MSDICFDYFKEGPVADDYNFVRKHDAFTRETDRKLEVIAYGVLGSFAREIGRKIKKGFYYLTGNWKKYD